MKTLVLLLALTCAGCASGQFNRQYARSSQPEPATEISYGLPESPHSF